LGHYKALIERHKNSDIDTEYKELFAKQTNGTACKQTFWVYMYVCLIMPWWNGDTRTKQRWQSVANVIIFRDNVRIHRTQVIPIYKANYNRMLGIKWRIALCQAEALCELNTGLYGFRPRRNAFDPVFIEELQFEISRALRKMLAQTNYDALACYDRNIPNLAMMVSKKFGVLHYTNQMRKHSKQR
jgi:hypothetical protein